MKGLELAVLVNDGEDRLVENVKGYVYWREVVWRGWGEDGWRGGGRGGSTW